MNEQDYKMYLDALEKSKNAREVEVKLLGDRGILINLVNLLAQIRSTIQSNQPSEIKLNIGKNIQNGYFNFLVNDSEVDDLVAQNELDIN